MKFAAFVTSIKTGFTFSITKDMLSSQKMTLKFPGAKGLNLSIEDYPLMTSSRQEKGLRMTLSRNEKVYFVNRCTSPSFLVHSPYELPGSYELFELFEFGTGYDFEVLITPEIIKTDEDLKSYDPQKRGCYFQGERMLKYFKVYTKNNCIFECRAEQFFKVPELNCTPYFMVRSDDMEFCDYRREYRVRQQMLFLFLDDYNLCGCLDACDSIQYRTEVLAHNLVRTNESVGDFLAYYHTTFHFKFKDVDVIPLRRYRQMTFSDFLAQSGGMMGLFAGISALSIIEMFYFLTLRWMTNLCRWIKTKLRNNRT
jgi:acid-sensing ion channel, other